MRAGPVKSANRVQMNIRHCDDLRSRAPSSFTAPGVSISHGSADAPDYPFSASDFGAVRVAYGQRTSGRCSRFIDGAFMPCRRGGLPPGGGRRGALGDHGAAGRRGVDPGVRGRAFGTTYTRSGIRMSWGSYMRPPLGAVEIPKKGSCLCSSTCGLVAGRAPMVSGRAVSWLYRPSCATSNAGGSTCAAESRKRSRRRRVASGLR